jgi:hypothetical protein
MFCFKTHFVQKKTEKNIHKIRWCTVLDMSASRFTELHKDRQKEHKKLIQQPTVRNLLFI